MTESAIRANALVMSLTSYQAICYRPHPCPQMWDLDAALALYDDALERDDIPVANYYLRLARVLVRCHNWRGPIGAPDERWARFNQIWKEEFSHE